MVKKMLKLQDTEKLDLTTPEKSMSQSILGHLYYYLDNGFTEKQIRGVLHKLLDEMEK